MDRRGPRPSDQYIKDAAYDVRAIYFLQGQPPPGGTHWFLFSDRLVLGPRGPSPEGGGQNWGEATLGESDRRRRCRSFVGFFAFS